MFQLGHRVANSGGVLLRFLLTLRSQNENPDDAKTKILSSGDIVWTLTHSSCVDNRLVFNLVFGFCLQQGRVQNSSKMTHERVASPQSFGHVSDFRFLQNK